MRYALALLAPTSKALPGCWLLAACLAVAIVDAPEASAYSRALAVY
jgi:hypothetical protein